MGNIKMKFDIKSILLVITIIAVVSAATSRKRRVLSKSKLARAIEVRNKWTTADKGGIIYLDRQNVECPTGAGLTSFKLERDQGANKVRYFAKCVAHLAIKNENPTSHQTGLNAHKNESGNRGTNYLDRQHVKCPAGSVLTQFKLSTVNSQIRYDFKCAKAELGKCYSKTTSKTQGGKNYQLWYLDRQNNVQVTQPLKQAMTGFKLKTIYHNSFSAFFSGYNVEYRYEITYCDLKNVANEQPQDPVLEKQETEQNLVDHREREVRRRFK